MNNKLKLFFAAVYLSCSYAAYAQTQAAFNGQFSGWLTTSPEPVWESQAGIRYIPEFSLNYNLTSGHTLDSDLAANMYGTGAFRSGNTPEFNGRIKPYRFWIRFASTKYEVRAGLQKINFGSAVMLRPLMWFDRIDPRDPLQITDGVYALLGRYYFLNNANIWIWGLYGNDETKGWELFPTKDKKPEFGSRFQLPVLTGEMALSYHERTAQAYGAYFSIKTPEFIAKEKRYGLDGKWDAGIGLWFEGALIYQDLPVPSLRYRRMLTLGVDYTFGFGNGLYVQSEYLRIDNSDKPEKLGVASSLIALSSSYPVGLFDNFRGLIYHDFKNENWYRFLSWQRTYDNFTFYIMGFWNPEIFNIYQNQNQNTFFAGKGIQLMLVFNH